MIPNDFENFLQNKFLKEFIGTKDQSIDAFDNFIENLSSDEWIKYGNKFAEEIRAELSARK